MKSLTYVEIDVPYCALTYGVAPCTASLDTSPPTGTRKCFNTINTCQDIANFDEELITLRFAVPTDYLPAEIEAIPSIEDVTFNSSIVSLGADLGQRATLTVTFGDHRHSDTGPGFDKYLSERDYNPFEQGTFWGKFRARQPFLVNRKARIIRGLLGQTLAEMETRHFIIESFDGPGPDGKYKLVAKDFLKLADGSRAQAPRLSNGFLAGDINSSVTAATLSPTGIGNAEYPASGHIAIGGSEICAFTRSADALTLTRAQLGTTAAAHSTQDRVQLCLYYQSETPATIIADLFENYADAPSAYIPNADWEEECDLFLQRQYTGVVAEPTAVNKLISELIEQAGLVMWSDDTEEEVRLQVLRGIQTDAVRFYEANYLEGSLTIKEQPEKRLSEVWVYFGKINPLRSPEDIDNYRSSARAADDDAAANYGAVAIKKIYSRWIPAGGRSVAERLIAIILGRFKNPPRRFNFELLRYGPQSISLGLGGKLAATCLQDDTGAAIDVPIQITRLDPDADKMRVEAEEFEFEVSDDFDDRNIIIDSNTNNVNLRDLYDILYPTPLSGDEVNCIISEGVIVGSVSTSTPAFDVGSWPAGVILNLDIRGRIQGMGGLGGFGANFSGPGGDGSPGGLALYTRFAIFIEGVGEIWGGGGGGGGGGSSLSGGVSFSFGGGGGQGQLPGAGGTTFAVAGAYGPSGTTEAPGSNGGAEGQAGSTGNTGDVTGPGAGGAAGQAIDGDFYITESGSLDVQGARVN